VLELPQVLAGLLDFLLLTPLARVSPFVITPDEENDAAPVEVDEDPGSTFSARPPRRGAVSPNIC